MRERQKLKAIVPSGIIEYSGSLLMRGTQGNLRTSGSPVIAIRDKQPQVQGILSSQSFNTPKAFATGVGACRDSPGKQQKPR